jgi:putative transposase
LLAVVVPAANLPDRPGGRLVRNAAGKAFPRLQRIGAEQGDTGALIPWTAREQKLRWEVSSPAFRQLQRYAPDVAAELGDAPGFRVLPKRWIVERTVSWSGRQRRMRQEPGVRALNGQRRSVSLPSSASASASSALA